MKQRCGDKKCKCFGQELVKSTIMGALVCPSSIYAIKSDTK